METIWNLHSHSRFSVNDAIGHVEQMVDTVVGYQQPALGLTEHGNMASAVQLYQACSRAGIKPFPGTELYVVHDRNDKKAKRHHMCVVAYTTEGYENLVKLNSLTAKNFFNKPIIDHRDFAELSENGMLAGLAGTSGCYFGFVSQAIVKEDEATARSLLAAYNSWFVSSGGLYVVELQNHNITHDEPGWDDDTLADALWEHARSIGIPCVLTQDAHYCQPDDKPVHETLKRIVAFGSDADDAVFPGDGFHLGDSAWLAAHHPPKRRAAGVEGLGALLELHDLSIRQLDNYSYNIPFTVADPQRDLVTRTMTALSELQLSGRYLDRLSEELETIQATGMAGYLLLVAEVTDWCKDNGIFYQARGSASGSICCWLLGITQVDPIKWDLDFERFISRDRVKPPDVDLDVEHERRQDVIDWLETRFAVHQIGTWSEHGLKSKEDAEGNSSGVGSLRVRYYARKRATGQEIVDWKDVPQRDKYELSRLADYKPFNSYGTHAAGMVLTTTNDEFAKLVPLMKVASSGVFVTQYEMDDIEALGLVKLDLLGLKTLSVLHRCMEFLGRDVAEGLDWIPLRDDKTFRTITRGDTDGVFQLEGWAAKRGVRDLKVTKIDDVIAAMALFRPATMDSGATAEYIARKNGEQSVPTRHPMLMEQTKKTFGIFLFQEQVISVLRQLGMGAQDLTKFLKAVKASNQGIGSAGDVIQNYREQVRELARDFSEEDFEWMWASFTGFAAYGFNKAHSTAYGITAYRCAYLLTHHPVEFLAAVLAVAAGTPKESNYVTATRAHGIRVVSPDVNRSGFTYSVDRGRVIRGLLSVKGIGEKAANELISKRPPEGYKSISDIAELVDHRKVTGILGFLSDGDLSGSLGKLADAGALKNLE